MPRATTAAGRLGKSLWLAAAATICAAQGCTCSPSQDPIELGATGIPLDSMFPKNRVVVLEETPAAIVGSLVNLAVDSSGEIYIADFGMRNVKVYDSAGAFLRTLGSQGRGPGEYIAPVHVTASTRDARVGVVDIAQSRLILYDGNTHDPSSTLALTPPVSLHSAILGSGDTLFLAGVDKNQGSDRTFGAAIVVGTGKNVAGLVPVPRRLQGKALSGNLLFGVMGESATRLFMALNASPEIYRLNLSGRVLDSLRLPPALFPELALPEMRDWRETPNAMQQFMQAHTWIEALQPLNDSTLVVQVINAADSGQETTRQFILVSWGARPRASSSAPCRCRIVGGRGGELAMVQADSTGAAPHVEFRRLAPR